MTNLEKETILVCIKNMFKKGYIDICAIRKCIDIAGIVPDANDLKILEALHCVNFSEMRFEHVHEIKLLVMKVLSSPELDLSDFVIDDSGKIASGHKIFGFLNRRSAE